MSTVVELSANQPTSDDLVETAKQLTRPAVENEIKQLLSTAIGIGLSKINKETLFGEIAKQTGLPKSTIRETYSQQLYKETGSLGDSSYEIAVQVIEKTFKGGEHIRFSPMSGFEQYVGTHWTILEETSLRGFILQEIQESGVKDSGGVSVTVSKAFACVRDILSARQTLPDELAPGNIVNTLSGELHLQEDGTFALKPHSPESNLRNCLSFEFDPDATAPKFKKALTEIFEEASDPKGTIRHFLEVVGYTVQSERDIAAFVIFYGEGANGKTSILKTIEKLLPQEAVLSENLQKFHSDKFANASLKGKLVLIDDDCAERLLLDEAFLKRVSETKQISARGAYQRHKETFQSTVLPIMAGNSLPRTKDVSYGTIRRALLFPFDKVFTKEERNPNLFKEIWKSEMPGVLNLALAGLARLRARGAFDPSADCERALKEFVIHSNPLTSFIDSECEHDGEARTKRDPFCEMYRAWAKDQGLSHVDATDYGLGRKLKALGFEYKKVNGTMTIYGLRLKSPPSTMC